MKLLRMMALAVAVAAVSPKTAGAAPDGSAGRKKAAASKKSKKAAPAKNAPGVAGGEKEEREEKDERRPKAQFREVPKLEDAAKEALADKKRDEAIENLLRIVDKFKDGSPQKADVFYQLSEFYWEKSKYLYRKEMAAYHAAEKAYDDARNRGEKVTAPKEDHTESEKYRAQTIELYEKILKSYPAYDRKDEVLFSLGMNLSEKGQKKEAVKRYSELIKNYPDSKFVPDAFVELGNYYFDDANDLDRARENYEKALATKIPKIYSYALYKLAWCDFNSKFDGHHEAALKKMHQVVEYAETQGKSMVDLKNEALNDMVRIYVELNRSDDAIDYFKRKAPRKKQLRLVSKMAGQLAEAGHHDNAIKTYRYLIKEEPLSASAPVYQQAIVKSFEGLRRRDQVRAEIKVLVDTYRPGSEWWKANESKKTAQREAFDVTEEAMRTMVTEYHQEAQKTKQVETYRLARDIYKQYVEAFASSSDESLVSDFAFNLRFYYAEILWALEEWENAAREYEAVIAFKIPNRDEAKQVADERHRKSASYNTILAYEKLVKIERGVLAKSELKEGQKVEEQKKKGNIEKTGKIERRSAKELAEQPLTAHEQKLVAACDTYNKLFPGNQDEIDVRYQAAVVYYDRNHFVEAAKRFGEIILKWPEEKRSQEAADLSMYVLEAKGEWLELNKLARQFQSNKKLAKAGTEFTKRVSNVVEGSQYKWVDEVLYKKEKNPARAAEEFLKFVEEFPKSNNADRALTYAMVIFQDANQIDRGILTGERVLKEYPDSPFELKARYTLARFYEQTANFEKSAQMYEAFIAAYDAVSSDAPDTKGSKAKSKPKAKKATTREFDPAERDALIKEAKGWLADAQFNAALWWEGLGKSDKAIAAYNVYLTRFKDRPDVPEIHFNIGLIHEKDKKWNEAIKHFEAFNTTYAKDSRAKPALHYRAKYRQMLSWRKLENGREAQRLEEELVKTYGKLPQEAKADAQVLNAYAHARFLALEPMWKAYTEIKLVKVATIAKDLKAKTKKIQEVEKAYTDVLAVGAGEWGIAALTRIGLAYADFASNILESPDPKGLTPEQLDMYRGELENRAFPLEEKSIEALEKALVKSSELALYNDWTLLAQDRINKYRPGLFGKVREVPYRGSEFFVTAPVQKDAGKVASALEAPAPAAPAAPVPTPAPKPAPTPIPTASSAPAAAAGGQ